MSFITRLALCSLLVVVFAYAVPAQKRFCPVPPPSPFKHDGHIVTSYDPSVDRMRTTLEHPRVLGRGTDAVYLSATFLHQDPRRPAPATLDVLFISTSALQKYRDAHDLVLYIDGRARSFAGATRYQSHAAGRGVVYEATRVTLTYEDLLALTRSHKVSARLGQTAFELTNNHLEALRELVSLLVPSPTRWRAE